MQKYNRPEDPPLVNDAQLKLQVPHSVGYTHRSCHQILSKKRKRLEASVPGVAASETAAASAAWT